MNTFVRCLTAAYRAVQVNELFLHLHPTFFELLMLIKTLYNGLMPFTFRKSKHPFFNFQRAVRYSVQLQTFIRQGRVIFSRLPAVHSLGLICHL